MSRNISLCWEKRGLAWRQNSYVKRGNDHVIHEKLTSPDLVQPLKSWTWRNTAWNKPSNNISRWTIRRTTKQSQPSLEHCQLRDVMCYSGLPWEMLESVLRCFLVCGCCCSTMRSACWWRWTWRQKTALPISRTTLIDTPGWNINVFTCTVRQH